MRRRINKKYNRLNHDWNMCEKGISFIVYNVVYHNVGNNNVKICLKCGQQAYYVDPDHWYACNTDQYGSELLSCEEYIIKNIIE